MKVLDFGVATPLPRPDEPPGSGPGGEPLVGSPLYMVRERLRGGPPAATWDVWSLALVAFEALTGAHPFPGPDLASRRRAILEGRRLACGQALQGAAAGWEGFFSKALHTDPACRFASAAGFGDGLARACGDLPGGETPPRRES